MVKDKKITVEKPKVKNQNLLKYISALSIVILSLVFFIINSSFFGTYNLKNILIDAAPLLIMACGATLVIMLGSIDLSIGAVCSVANVMFIALIPNFGFWAYPLTALFGVFAGFLLGFVHVKIKIPSFIASLGFMSIWMSVALLISESPVSVSKAHRYLIDWAGVSVGIINITTVVAVLFILLFYFVQTRTAVGKGILSIGGNERSSRLAGIPVDKIKWITFIICGLCSALGGIVFAAKLKSSAPTIGEPFTLLVIASVVLGGTALSGGKGSLIGTILGVALVTIIQNGMNIIGVGAFWQQIAFGVVVILAVMLTVDRTRQNAVVK